MVVMIKMLLQRLRQPSRKLPYVNNRRRKNVWLIRKRKPKKRKELLGSREKNKSVSVSNKKRKKSVSDRSRKRR